MPKTRSLLALVLVPLLFFLVACGGDDDDDGDSGNGSGQPTATEATGGGTSGGNSGSSSDSSDDEDEDDEDSPDVETILENCPELIAAFGTISAIGAGGDPNAEFSVEDSVEAFQNAADNAPDEIKADFQVMANAFADFAAALEDLGVDLNDPASFAALNPEQQAQLLAALQSFDTAELTEASNNLSAYFTEHCS